MANAASQPEEPFQPGQLGMRHLLGVITVVAIAMGVAAARLRTLSLVEATQVALHWCLLAMFIAGTFFYNSSRLRRNRIKAGEVLLRANSRPMTESRRRAMAIVLTICVVLDAIFVSVAAIPAGSFSEFLHTEGPTFNSLVYMMVGEALLWILCLNHWLTNVYWVEFRQHGLLTPSWYLPWDSITRIGWSCAHPQNLVIIHGGVVSELSIDPAAHDAVDHVLAAIRCKPNQ